ncbi:uncharacterized protein LOC143181433 [Calliopsis andreniformis]|uniref:uncharacterized protein LOC143181433 n=1 Tax=Calliopsis andreniformis TaxID=337506 RepID=UPI003FCDBC55
MNGNFNRGTLMTCIVVPGYRIIEEPEWNIVTGLWLSGIWVCDVLEINWTRKINVGTLVHQMYDFSGSCDGSIEEVPLQEEKNSHSTILIGKLQENSESLFEVQRMPEDFVPPKKQEDSRRLLYPHSPPQLSPHSLSQLSASSRIRQPPASISTSPQKNSSQRTKALLSPKAPHCGNDLPSPRRGCRLGARERRSRPKAVLFFPIADDSVTKSAAAEESVDLPVQAWKTQEQGTLAFADLKIPKACNYVGKKPPGQFCCGRCGRSYMRKDSLQRHVHWECGKEPQFQCPFCPQRCKRKAHWLRHIRRQHFDRMGDMEAYLLAYTPKLEID